MATKGEISEQSDLVKALFDFIYSDEGSELVKSVGLITAGQITRKRNKDDKKCESYKTKGDCLQ